MVTFRRDMMPWRRGDDYVLPDKAADHLIADGVAYFKPSLFDAPKAPEPERRKYTTRKARVA